MAADEQEAGHRAAQRCTALLLLRGPPPRAALAYAVFGLGCIKQGGDLSNPL